jgi:hypothetical protein
VRCAPFSLAVIFGLFFSAGDSRAYDAEPYTWQAVPESDDQIALYRGSEQIGNYLFSKQTFHAYDPAKDTFDKKPTACPVAAPVQTANESTNALAEVNAARAVRGLRPFILDDGLTKAALGAARFRAANRIAGHTANDFAYLPADAQATAAGCAAWHDSWGWGSCCTYESRTYAGAAWVRGSDGRRYMHLFVR